MGHQCPILGVKERVELIASPSPIVKDRLQQENSFALESRAVIATQSSCVLSLNPGSFCHSGLGNAASEGVSGAPILTLGAIFCEFHASLVVESNINFVDSEYN